MANIMINKVCNLQCPYCFANKYVNSSAVKDKNNITIDNFKKALSFVTQTESGVGIIGGEPLLHPEFKEIIQMVIDNEKIKKAIVFTNGIHLDKYLDILSNEKIRLLINVNSPDIIGEETFKKIMDNIDALNDKIGTENLKRRVSFGVNLYKGADDYSYIFRITDKYSYNKIRMSVTVPNTEEKENESPDAYFGFMKPIVLKFFKECDKHNLIPYYDCNYVPACVYTKEEFEWIKDYLNRHKNKSDTLNLLSLPYCFPVIDILPNLNAIRCFGFSKCEIAISKFRNVDELSRFFIREIDNYADNINADDKCENCYDKCVKLCSGGCLSFKHRKINQLRTITKIFNEK